MDTLTVYFGALWNWLQQLPAEFWGIIVGSLLALAGVVLSNRANLKALREQFKHQRDIETKDREHALRKEVYLDAADAITAGTQCLSRFGDLDLSHDEITQAYEAKSGAISRVNVIAGVEVVTAVASLSSRIGQGVLKLTAQRFVLVNQKKEIEGLQAAIQRSSAETDRYIELMKQYNFEGMKDERRWKFLTDSVEYEQKRSARLSQECSALADDLYPKRLRYIEDCVREVHGLQEFILPALIAVRGELEMPIDEAACREVFVANAQAMQVAFEEFTQQLKKEVEG